MRPILISLSVILLLTSCNTNQFPGEHNTYSGVNNGCRIIIYFHNKEADVALKDNNNNLAHYVFKVKPAKTTQSSKYWIANLEYVAHDVIGDEIGKKAFNSKYNFPDISVNLTGGILELNRISLYPADRYDNELFLEILNKTIRLNSIGMH